MTAPISLALAPIYATQYPLIAAATWDGCLTLLARYPNCVLVAVDSRAGRTFRVPDAATWQTYFGMVHLYAVPVGVLR
jgi:hypothetical protein